MYILYLTILYIISSCNNGSHLLNFINACSVPRVCITQFMCTVCSHYSPAK